MRRRSPRLSGTLHIRDATGRELVVPLRGRSRLLTTSRAGLCGYGAVWAVSTGAPASPAAAKLLIVYCRTGADDDRRSGLCAAGRTITLDGVDFTWRALPAPERTVSARVPRPRTAAGNLRPLPARTTNTRAEPARTGGLRDRLRNMVRVVTQATRH